MRTILTVHPLRLGLAFTAGALLLVRHGPVASAVAAVAVLVGSAAVLGLVPERLRARPEWGARLAVADGLWVALAVLVAGSGEPALVAACAAAALAAGWAGRAGGALVVAAYLAAWGIGVSGAPPGGAAIGLRVLLVALTAASAATGSGWIASRVESAYRARNESRELRALLEITEAVTATLDLGKVMDLIVRRVGDLVRADRCSVLLVDERNGQGWVLAASDNPEAESLEIDLTKYPEIRRAVESREPVFVEDVASDPIVEPVRQVLLDQGYRSILVLPLVFGREVLGTLFLRASRNRPFRQEEIRFCRVAAAASANALKNALLFRDVALEAARHRTTGETLRRVLDGSPDMIVAADAEDRITEFNQIAERLTGISAENARGKPFDDVIAAATSPADSGELVLEDAEGAASTISWKSAPLTTPEGTCEAGKVWIGRDVTELRRIERSLAQAERLSSLGEVVAGVAHELNNPLTGVLGYAELMRPDLAGHRRRRDLDRIIECGKRCQRIVSNLLSFARQHPPERRVEDLGESIRSVLELKTYQLRARQIEVEVDVQPGLPRARFDPHQIEQVLLNLLNNAEQAIASTGGPGSVLMRARADGDRVVVDVQDDGPGVPAEVRERIFDPFFTTKPSGKGTGLGLSVSFGILRENGGGIELAADPPGGGTRFRLWLPAAEATATSAPAETATAPVAARPAALEGRRVLVAEDEPVVLDFLSRILLQDGAEVTTARSGEEAWERILETDFDLIVTDLRMPELDGEGLYRRVAEERPEMLRRFVFATGDLVRHETLRFLENLPNRILAKPLDVETVRRVLGQALSVVPS